MQKPTIFVTRRWPKETVEEMKKFFEVTINQDDRPLTQSEIADGFESHDALAPTVSDNIDQNIIKKDKIVPKKLLKGTLCVDI